MNKGMRSREESIWRQHSRWLKRGGRRGGVEGVTGRHYIPPFGFAVKASFRGQCFID